MTDQGSEIDKLKRRLNAVEVRLRRLESAMAYPGTDNSAITEEEVQPTTLATAPDSTADEGKGLESQIGRFGLAWMGNIVLLFGITFLTQYLINLGHQLIAVIIGYIVAATIFFLADYLKKTNTHLSFIFKMNAQVLLYYMTLRLHFFSAAPLIAGKALSGLLLLAIVAFQAYLAIRNKSQSFAALALLFALTTAVTADSTLFTLPLITLTAASAVFYFYRVNWKALVIVSVILTYGCFFLWLLGNPLMGHPLQLITEKYLAVISLFTLGAMYSILLIFRDKDAIADDFLIGLTFINGLFFTISLLFVVISFFTNGYVFLFSGITIGCLIYSTVLHSKSKWNFASAFYALYGFMAMSIALYGLFGLPRVYLLLSVQSLIVVSMALWFRNKLIVIMNSLLFISILMIYLLSSKPTVGINFSFALVALISARIINWQNSRLQIKTDLIRNLYMTEGFFMVLFALGHALPKQFVTLSWTLAALLYFLVSIILKNVKYRYMALGTMISAALYLFIVDLARIEIVFRVLALLFLAAISIGISVYYTNRSKKPADNSGSSL
jgi:hypothetical protein